MYIKIVGNVYNYMFEKKLFLNELRVFNLNVIVLQGVGIIIVIKIFNCYFRINERFGEYFLIIVNNCIDNRLCFLRNIIVVIFLIF